MENNLISDAIISNDIKNEEDNTRVWELDTDFVSVEQLRDTGLLGNRVLFKEIIAEMSKPKEDIDVIYHIFAVLAKTIVSVTPRKGIELGGSEVKEVQLVAKIFAYNHKGELTLTSLINKSSIITTKNLVLYVVKVYLLRGGEEEDPKYEVVESQNTIIHYKHISLMEFVLNIESYISLSDTEIKKVGGSVKISPVIWLVGISWFTLTFMLELNNINLNGGSRSNRHIISPIDHRLSTFLQLLGIESLGKVYANTPPSLNVTKGFRLTSGYNITNKNSDIRKAKNRLVLNIFKSFVLNSKHKFIIKDIPKDYYKDINWLRMGVFNVAYILGVQNGVLNRILKDLADRDKQVRESIIKGEIAIAYNKSNKPVATNVKDSERKLASKIKIWKETISDITIEIEKLKLKLELINSRIQSYKKVVSIVNENYESFKTEIHMTNLGNKIKQSKIEDSLNSTYNQIKRDNKEKVRAARFKTDYQNRNERRHYSGIVYQTNLKST